MTLVEITYELQSPLTEEQLRHLGQFANTYGLRSFRVNDPKSELSGPLQIGFSGLVLSRNWEIKTVQAFKAAKRSRVRGSEKRKNGAPAWDREPRKARFNCGCRFHTDAWGHPS